MRPFFLKTVLLCALTAFASGCTVLVAGGVGAVGGYALSRDTFEGVNGKGQDEIWDAAHKVAAIMGAINEEQSKEGVMDATVYGAHVTISIIPVNLTTTSTTPCTIHMTGAAASRTGFGYRHPG